MRHTEERVARPDSIRMRCDEKADPDSRLKMKLPGLSLWTVSKGTQDRTTFSRQIRRGRENEPKMNHHRLLFLCWNILIVCNLPVDVWPEDGRRCADRKNCSPLVVCLDVWLLSSNRTIILVHCIFFSYSNDMKEDHLRAVFFSK